MSGRKYVPGNVIGGAGEFPPGQIIDFDVNEFDEIVAGKGVMLQHFVAMRCPGGLIDLTDSLRRPHEDHLSCSNGMLYSYVGTIQALFSGNNKEFRNTDLGLLDPSIATVTFPRTYIDGSPFFGAPLDRFFLSEKNIVVTNWQLVENNPIGLDRLLFPATSILDLVDSRGIKYQLGDYQLEAGQISWIPGQRSRGSEPATGKGRVYSVRYLYHPFWYLVKMIHDIRLVQNLDNDGVRTTSRGPQTAQLQREFMFQSTDADGQARDSATNMRQSPRPSDGSLPSR